MTSQDAGRRLRGRAFTGMHAKALGSRAGSTRAVRHVPQMAQSQARHPCTGQSLRSSQRPRTAGNTPNPAHAPRCRSPHALRHQSRRPSQRRSKATVSPIPRISHGSRNATRKITRQNFRWGLASSFSEEPRTATAGGPADRSRVLCCFVGQRDSGAIGRGAKRSTTCVRSHLFGDTQAGYRRVSLDVDRNRSSHRVNRPAFSVRSPVDSRSSPTDGFVPAARRPVRSRSIRRAAVQRAIGHAPASSCSRRAHRAGHGSASDRANRSAIPAHVANGGSAPRRAWPPGRP
jgi:hypothetical protein